MAEEMGDAVLFGNSPHLKKLVHQIGNIPQIKDYVNARPKSKI